MLPYVKDALASMRKGGYNEAFARVAYLTARKGDLPLSRLEMRQEMAKEYHDYLPELKRDEWRRVRGEQEIIASYEPEQAVATLPDLLHDAADRKKILELLARVLADKRIQKQGATEAQLAMVERIRGVLSAPAPSVHRLPAAKRR
jgi:hypothetical protein